MVVKPAIRRGKVRCSQVETCGGKEGSCPHRADHTYTHHCEGRCSVVGELAVCKEVHTEDNHEDKMRSIWES